MRWLEEIAEHIEPLADSEREAFTQRLDAWSNYLMGLYSESYRAFTTNLREADPALRTTSSVQIDHAPVRQGQYFPDAYGPLDFRYQTTWNDQVGGPDYSYQWLYTAALLAMDQGDHPVWIGNAFGPVHGRAKQPGKFVRVAAHGLVHGQSGIGFAHEGFSNLLGGMNSHSAWDEIKDGAGGADVRAGRDFLDRFAALAVEGRGDFGIGILFSRSQYARQHVTMGFGTSSYMALVALMRLGYTPRFVTEEEISASPPSDIDTLFVAGQTFALPEPVIANIKRFVDAGGRVMTDDNTTVALPAAEKLGYAFPFTRPGKPHSWGAPNFVVGDNDALFYARVHAELAPRLAAVLGATGRGQLTSEAGVATQVNLMQINGGPDATYVVAVNDSHIASQADWVQVTETLLPNSDAAAVLFDCTEEKSLGKLAPFTCDLTRTTARVFGILAQAPTSVSLSASQQISEGDSLVLRVAFLNAEKQVLRAVIPFRIVLKRPDGQTAGEYYRSTDREGRFAMSLPIGIGEPTGQWVVEACSQLDGMTSRLPIAVAPASAQAGLASALTDPVITRNAHAIGQALTRGTTVVLPFFEAQQTAGLRPVAEKVKAVLSLQGITVDIRPSPIVGTYTLAYDPTETERTENAAIDRGERIGKIKRTTVNNNDWFSALSGYRFGKPIILLDLAGQADNEMAEALDKTKWREIGLLWPRVTPDFPGAGRAVVQGIDWAFGPRVPAVVIQAADAAGLMAAAEALKQLPADRLTPAIQQVKDDLWKQYHIGGAPTRPATKDLTASGLLSAHAPHPFTMALPTGLPPKEGESPAPAAVAHPYRPVPGTFASTNYVIQLRGDADDYIESATAAFLVPDLRFSDAIKLYIDVKASGPYRIAATGLFRYNDRKPCWQAQWETILNLRENVVPQPRRPMHIDVRVDDQPVGELVSTKVEEKEVKLQLASPSAGLKPRTAVEEVVTELSCDVDLPAGRHELLLIHRNIVDGKLDEVRIEPKGRN